MISGLIFGLVAVLVLYAIAFFASWVTYGPLRVSGTAGKVIRFELKGARLNSADPSIVMLPIGYLSCSNPTWPLCRWAYDGLGLNCQIPVWHPLSKEIDATHARLYETEIQQKINQLSN